MLRFAPAPSELRTYLVSKISLQDHNELVPGGLYVQFTGPLDARYLNETLSWLERNYGRMLAHAKHDRTRGVLYEIQTPAGVDEKLRLLGQVSSVGHLNRLLNESLAADRPDCSAVVYTQATSAAKA